MQIRNLSEAQAFLEKRVDAQRAAAVAAGKAKRALARSFLFDKEIALADDPHRYVTACCGRRAGKTTTVAAVMLTEALKSSARFSVLYLSITRDQAKGTLWPKLKEVNELFGLGGESNEADLTMTMPNGVVIALRGVDKRKEIEKRRGFGFALVVIDECQSIPEHVKSLVNEVIEPALVDAGGRIFMIGTPSLLLGGYWYECHHNENLKDGQKVYGHHFWTMWDNPHLHDQDDFLAGVLARNGIDIQHPFVRREYFGEWVRDASSAVFTFDPEKNTYDGKLPTVADASLWRYVISVDIGGGVERDNDAITALAFHAHLRATYLLEEHVDATQDVTALAERVAGIRSRLGARNVVAVVADTGGIGAKVAKEMQTRHKIPVEPAKKKDKWANIALLNAACNHGEFFAPKGSKFATESVKVEKDWEKSSPEKIEIKGHMPDVCDSTLYGYIESLAWNAKPAPQTEEEKRNELAAIVKRAATPPTKEQLEQQAKQDMERYAKEMAKEQRQREREERWGW